jgi:hypothetical protein
MVKFHFGIFDSKQEATYAVPSQLHILLENAQEVYNSYQL